jgi:hypothetical protein
MSSSSNAIKAGGPILRYKNFRRFVTFCEEDSLPLETLSTHSRLLHSNCDPRRPITNVAPDIVLLKTQIIFKRCSRNI